MENNNYYKIGQVAARTGLPPYLIRVWESRYSAVSPRRSSGNRRIFGEDDIRKLQLLSKAVESGHSISQIAPLSQEELTKVVESKSNKKRFRIDESKIASTKAEPYLRLSLQCVAELDINKLQGILDEAAERLKEIIATYPGTGDITDNYTLGKREVKVRLKPEARTLGITEENLGRQLRGAFYGSEALRLQRGRDEVKVLVRYPEDSRSRFWNLETMRLRVPGGGEIPLSRAASLEESRGFSKINRTDRKRVINVTATVDSHTANAEEILAEIKQTALPKLVSDYPGLSYDLEGEDKNRRESMASMLTGFKLVLIVIFALLAIPFRSYSQPVLIMIAIPFGIVGAILGHFVMGYDLSILSMFGIVALTGVVVNDSLLLIDYINRHRRDGKPLNEAVTIAGQRRFRPILLTSLTTFFGLTPMILETSVQAQFLVPMAISLAFGILFATGITLLLIPALYLILEDGRSLLGLAPAHADHRADA
jgi:multidrug efflux pump subunit AcrB